MRKVCTWEEAEAALPGCSAEWDMMVLMPETVTKGKPPGAYGPIQELLIQMEVIDMGNGKTGYLLWVTQNELRHWVLPPCWARDQSGDWYSMPAIRHSDGTTWTIDSV